MAEENKILYKITVDTETATAQIRKLGEGALKRTQIAVEDVNKVLGEMNGEMSRTSSQIGKTMTSLKKQRSQVQINSKEYQNLTKVMRFYQSQMDMSTGATGSASSAAMELGRVLSDAPYGIRGVANNISQFASQMAFAAKSTGSLKLALMDLGKAMAGPLGILLIIQGVIAAFEKMSMAKQKAKEDSEDLNKALKEEINTLEGYESIINLSSSSLEERNNAIIAAIASSKTLSDEILNSQDSLFAQEQALKAVLEEKRKQLDINEKLSKVNSINKLLKEEENSIEKVQAALVDLKKDRTDALKAGMNAKSINTAYNIEKERLDGIITSLKERNKLLREAANLIEPPRKVIEGTEEYFDKAIAAAKKFRKQMLNDPKAYADQTKVIEGLIKEREALTGTKGKGGSKLSIFDTPEELELKVKSTLDARQKLAQKTEMINLKAEEKSRLSMVQSEEDKTFIKEEYALKRLDITEKYEKKAMLLKKQNAIKSAQETHAEYSRKVDKDLAKFISGIKKEGKALTDAEQKEIDRAETVAFDKKKNSGDRLIAAVTQIKDEYKALFPFWEQMAAARRAAIGVGKPVEDAKEFTLEDGLKEYMKLQSSMTDFLSAEYDRQLTIEQNKTNALNNELNQRLLNEDLSKDERERIQLQIGQNDEKLRKKQEAIEKKRFKLNKAANIANASINTYLAASQVLSSEVIPVPAKPFVMAATIASGLLQVAAIARQKFQSSAGSGGSIGAAAGSNGGGDNTREFNFNLAGSTQSNQLTQSIAGQLSQPIQTYVVSSEITSQQQLDLNIANTATIGG
jgi:hypothetical protein